jgi:hypothetical protein
MGVRDASERFRCLRIIIVLILEVSQKTTCVKKFRFNYRMYLSLSGDPGEEKVDERLAPMTMDGV